MKSRRHTLILKLIGEQRIENQEALKSELLRNGMGATQATLSRDLRELGLVKLADPAGGSFYARPSDAGRRTRKEPTLSVGSFKVRGLGEILRDLRLRGWRGNQLVLGVLCICMVRQIRLICPTVLHDTCHHVERWTFVSWRH
jgi:hypothetical protein